MKLQEEMFRLIEGWKESKMTKTAFINGKEHFTKSVQKQQEKFPKN